MGARVRCKKCGSQFTRPDVIGRPRVNCFACRPAKDTEIVRVVSQGEDGEEITTLAERTLAELTAAGRQESASGKAALLLAEHIDSARLRGMQLSVCIKQWLETMKVATGGVAVEADELDLLKSRRGTR